MNVTGIMIYYYFVCHKKLWYFLNQINMEQNSELVELGKIIDESTYQRENKQIMIDNTINIDFIKDSAVLHEVKKTKAIEEAGVWQVKYYMYYLNKLGIKEVEAKIDYPLIKQNLEVTLEESDKEILENIISEIEKMRDMTNSPSAINSKICVNCSYYDLCYV